MDEKAEHCSDTMCLFLPMGYALLTVDLCFDMPYVLRPSKKTASNLRNYYKFILTPSFYSPGYYWPVFATYVFLVECPDIYNWITFWCFVPIAYRYYFLLKKEDPNCSTSFERNYKHPLQHWWTIIIIRMCLYLVTYINLQNRACAWSDYGQHAVNIYERLFVNIPPLSNVQPENNNSEL